MNEMKQIVKSNIRQYMMIIILILIAVFFQIVTGGVLLKPLNVANLIQQNAYVVILAVGMMLCILTGGNVDLSVGSVLGFIGALCGVCMVGRGMNVWMVLGLCLVVALAAGAWHGFWIAHFGVPSFIATLSGMLIFRGLTYAFLSGKTYYSFPDPFLKLTTGFIQDYIGNGQSGLHITTLVIGAVAAVLYVAAELARRNKQRKNGLKPLGRPLFLAKLVLICGVILSFMYVLAQYRGIPVVLIPVTIIVLGYSYLMGNTVFGRHVYALGGNQKAAQLSGVNVKRVLFLVYANMAFLSAVAGMVLTARMNAASPKAGDGFELDAIAACYIGGASASGGVGTISGAMIGALVMGLLNNGMSILGIDTNLQMVVKGLVLLMAVVLDLIQKNRSRG